MTYLRTSAQISVEPAFEEPFLTALAHYPELAHTMIEVRYRKGGRKSVMLARPTFWSLFRKRPKRHYLILVREHFEISEEDFETSEIPEEVLTGWFAHELGHIMDYRKRSNLNLFWYGLKYLLSARHIRQAELAADRFAVIHGLQKEILTTKEYLLNHVGISDRYKNRLKKFYCSPEEILEMTLEEQD